MAGNFTGKFDAVDFLTTRRNKLPLSQDQLQHFQPFMVMKFVSMSSQFGSRDWKILMACNTLSWHRLPRDIQAMAWTTFDGRSFQGPWKLPKGGSGAKKDDSIIEKISVVYECSHNDAESMLNFKLIDIAKVESLYEKIADPDSIKFRGKHA
jgi:hypothetical protein